ncbi:alpha/beta hydrolase [Streptantibioticus cattleyicolor]|uniref:alpha/beta hydrolase n=1 Tax=Streptantibioticus cattleyicolor TaxID=29303 RepID=UPI000213D6D5|nr:alpha/beta hydrolase [Streptantibioticus cattleyicolor]CCB72128.1 Predicted hydrolase or acyltransferase of alpha/beta superfamily [Streptantibioticus cattleyicolor NRRL 8057 = DSM 46488]
MKRRPSISLALAANAVLSAAATGAAVAVAPAAAAGTPPALAWHDCHTAQTPASLECATLDVPLDRSRPDGPKIKLALDRLPATDPAHRVGPLLVNPGGPGGSGTAVVAQGGMLLGIPDLKPLREHFDIIGLDPRGVGESTPVRCSTPVYDPATPTLPADPAQYRRMVADSRAHGLDCAKATGPLIGHVDTVSAARDIDAVRAALGAPEISWLGVSYGTELGAAYAELFPGRVRAMVLDGAVDHSRSMARQAVEESAAIEREFGRFAAWCRGTADCPLHDRDIAGDFDALLARADRGEVTDHTLGRRVSAAEVTSAAYNHLALRFLWPHLATALAAAERTPSDPALLDQALPATDPGYTAYRAIGCQDFPPALRGYADLRDRMAAVERAAPHMWRYSEFWSWTTGCAGWPGKAANPPRPQHISGVPTILVVGNTYDPSTPYAWARSLAAHIDGSRLLTYDGDGHTALYHSSCARELEADYLVTTDAPAAGTVCRD